MGVFSLQQTNPKHQRKDTLFRSSLTLRATDWSNFPENGIRLSGKNDRKTCNADANAYNRIFRRMHAGNDSKHVHHRTSFTLCIFATKSDRF